MTETPEGDPRSVDPGDERTETRDAMAVYSTEGQADDETGGDAAAAAAVDPGESVEGDREPHGPA